MLPFESLNPTGNIWQEMKNTATTEQISGQVYRIHNNDVCRLNDQKYLYIHFPQDMVNLRFRWRFPTSHQPTIITSCVKFYCRVGAMKKRFNFFPAPANQFGKKSQLDLREDLSYECTTRHILVISCKQWSSFGHGSDGTNQIDLLFICSLNNLMMQKVTSMYLVFPFK